jgi:hypothetical protein
MVDFPPYRPLAGEWFYGANCPTCGVTVPFAMDPEDGNGAHAFTDYPGWIEMACKSHHKHRYRATELLRVKPSTV